MKSAILTGATGAIGSALVENLTARGVECLVLLRKNSGRTENLPRNSLVSVLTCSLDELSTLRNETGKTYGVFYHFAWAGTSGEARQDMRMQAENILYALDAVEAAKRFGCHTFIGAGSQAEYGRAEGDLKPNTPVFPENGYGIAKLCAGEITRIRARQLGLRHIWTRILSVYGPRDGTQSMISSAIVKLLHGERMLFTKGEQMWDYLYSEDAAEAFYAMGDLGKDGKTYVLGSGESRPLKDYIHIIARKLNAENRIQIGALPYAENQVMNLCADISELTRDTGWKPETTFEKGIEMTIKYIERGGGM